MDTEPEDTLGERLTRAEEDIDRLWIALGHPPEADEAPLWVGMLTAFGTFLAAVGTVFGPTVALLVLLKPA